MARPSISFSVQRQFWQYVKAGVPVAEAGPLVGMARTTGQRIYAQSGGVIPTLSEPITGKRLTAGERDLLGALRRGGFSNSQIARLMARHRSTIGRELARNCNQAGKYHPAAAQAETDRRARNRGRAASPAKLDTNPELRHEVKERLLLKHSPVQISRRLRQDFPDRPEMWVSHETIYQALYVQSRGALRKELTACLRTGRAMRKPRVHTDQRNSRGRFTNMVMISDRPPEITDRAVPGHWEGDLILGTGSGSAVGTLVERTTRFVMLLHLPERHTAEAVADAMIKKIAQLPQMLRRSVTWDQGSEMAEHERITAESGMKVYFCDPHSPWQRGTNENTNGLLRQYMPKGTDLSFHGEGLLDNYAKELNDRPRMTLNWRTPAEAMAALLSTHHTHPGVANTP